MTANRIILFLIGLLIGAYFIAFVIGGAIGINALAWMALVFVVIFLLKLLMAPNDENAQRDRLATLLGVFIGAVLAILVPALSPATLSGASQAIAAAVIIYLVVK